MLRALLMTGGLLVLLPSVQGGDDKLASEIKAIIGEYEKSNTELFKAYQAAKTPEERKEILSKRPQPAVYAKKLLALVNSAPKAPATVEALAWIAGTAGFTAEGKTAITMLIENHAKSPTIADSLDRLSRLTDPRMEKFFEQVVAENPNENAKGLAAYGLAKRYMSNADRGGRTMKQEQIDELYAKAEKMLETVKSRYGSVKAAKGTLADSVKDDLYFIKHFTVGKVAPEIVGEDTEGKKFKLSDYRGKVVLLDFWGHW